MKQYPEYKESGIEWLGIVPSHWRVLKIGRLSVVKRGASPRPIDDQKYFDENGEYSWVRISDVTASQKYLERTEQRLSLSGTSLSIPLEPGDIFLSIAGSVGKPIITKIKCCIHDGFVYFPEYKQNKKFLYYVFKSGQLYSGLGKLGTQLNLNTDTVSSISIALPTETEQHTIATYLDRETSRIDTLIAKKQRQIELLQEKRSALISHVVTKGLPAEARTKAGLDPDVRMKDSGVEWLGEVPEHWEVKRLKYIASINDEVLRENTDPDYEFDYVEINAVDAYDGITDIKRILFKDAPSRARRIVREGDVILSTVRTYLKAIAPIDKLNGTMIVSTGFAVIRPRRGFKSEYARYVLRSKYFIERVVQNSVGVSYPAINSEELVSLYIPVPPENEQIEIASYINKEISKLDGIRKKIENSIEKLREYRTALISAAVTGKIDVRDEVEMVDQDEEVRIAAEPGREYGRA